MTISHIMLIHVQVNQIATIRLVKTLIDFNSRFGNNYCSVSGRVLLCGKGRETGSNGWSDGQYLSPRQILW